MAQSRSSSVNGQKSLNVDKSSLGELHDNRGSRGEIGMTTPFIRDEFDQGEMHKMINQDLASSVTPQENFEY